MDFVTVSAPNLLSSNSLSSVPQRMAAVGLKSVLGANSQDGQEQLGRHLGWCECREMKEGQVLVEAVDVALQEPGQRVPRWKDKVVGKNRGELVESVLHDGMVRGRYPPVRSSHSIRLHPTLDISSVGLQRRESRRKCRRRFRLSTSSHITSSGP